MESDASLKDFHLANTWSGAGRSIGEQCKCEMESRVPATPLRSDQPGRSTRWTFVKDVVPKYVKTEYLPLPQKRVCTSAPEVPCKISTVIDRVTEQCPGWQTSDLQRESAYGSYSVNGHGRTARPYYKRCSSGPARLMSNTDSKGFLSLGVDIFYVLLSYLTPEDILNLGAACSQLRGFFHAESTWKNLCKRDFDVVVDMNGSYLRSYRFFHVVMSVSRLEPRKLRHLARVFDCKDLIGVSGTNPASLLQSNTAMWLTVSPKLPQAPGLSPLANSARLFWLSARKARRWFGLSVSDLERYYSGEISTRRQNTKYYSWSQLHAAAVKKHGSLEAFQRTLLVRFQQLLPQYVDLYPHYLQLQALERIADSLESCSRSQPLLVKALTDHLTVALPCEADYDDIFDEPLFSWVHDMWLDIASTVCSVHSVLREVIAGGPYIGVEDYMDVCVRLHNWLSHHNDLLPLKYRSSHMQLIYRYLAASVPSRVPLTVDSLVTNGIVLVQRLSNAWNCWSPARSSTSASELYKLEAFQAYMASGDDGNLRQLQCYLFGRQRLHVYLQENAWWLCKLLPTTYFLSLSLEAGIAISPEKVPGRKAVPLQDVDSNLYKAVQTFLLTGSENDFRTFLKIICELAGNGFQPLKVAYRQLVLSIAGLGDSS